MALGLGAGNIAEGQTWDPVKGKRVGQNWWTDTLDTLNPFASTSDIDAAAEQDHIEALENKFAVEIGELSDVKGGNLSIDGKTTQRDLAHRISKTNALRTARDAYVQAGGNRSDVTGLTDRSAIESATTKKITSLSEARDEKNHNRTVQTGIDAETRSNTEWAKRYKMQQDDQRAATERSEMREDRKDARHLKAQIADRSAARLDRKEARASEYRMRQDELDAKIFSTELNHLQAMQSEKNRVEDRKMQAQAMIMKALSGIGQAFAV